VASEWSTYRRASDEAIGRSIHGGGAEAAGSSRASIDGTQRHVATIRLSSGLSTTPIPPPPSFSTIR